MSSMMLSNAQVDTTRVNMMLSNAQVDTAGVSLRANSGVSLRADYLPQGA